MGWEKVFDKREKLAGAIVYKKSTIPFVSRFTGLPEAPPDTGEAFSDVVSNIAEWWSFTETVFSQNIVWLRYLYFNDSGLNVYADGNTVL